MSLVMSATFKASPRPYFNVPVSDYHCHSSYKEYTEAISSSVPHRIALSGLLFLKIVDASHLAVLHVFR
jgi:hypothetical protein